ncbi:DUF1513 domain-containing protein [Oceanisphaera psychrotolerans]|uniref:Twin-arginine translocation pathway signal n=1 Tax=Oceanisphaera psychrotolerans TaxID=1414654 RepID=A0A1J4QDH9_9GAMM|nr:DUF1513 domain-containing protein [Oceanisphaera psychrotolerans]OIN05534.1 hypothetical protein BFR47_04915 [Oceanisphaera psychrotolerans]
MQRRQFLKGLSAAGVLCSLGLAGCALPRSSQHYLIGGGRRGQNRYVVQALNLDGSLRYELPLPERGHGMAVHPHLPLAVCHARRPGHFLCLFDHQTGEQQQLRLADPHRHYYGHGVFSPDGQRLFTTEGVGDTSEGIIGVYELTAGRLEKVAEYRGFGTGPHEIRLLPNGNLVVGVGGVHTQGREPLNLDTMAPSLSYLDATTGELLEQTTLQDRQLSIRHLAVTRDGEVFTGQQYRGEPDDYPPLVVRHRPGQPLQPLGGTQLDWARFHHYIASIAVTDTLIAATSPPGNCYGLWHRHSGELIRIAPLPDASGAAVKDENIWLGSGQGGISRLDPAGQERRIYSPWSWDNHWSLIEASS